MTENQKENLATPIGEQAPINTPEANSGTVFFEDIIPQNSEKSNRIAIVFGFNLSKYHRSAKPCMVFDIRYAYKSTITNPVGEDSISSRKRTVIAFTARTLFCTFFPLGGSAPRKRGGKVPKKAPLLICGGKPSPWENEFPTLSSLEIW